MHGLVAMQLKLDFGYCSCQNWHMAISKHYACSGHWIFQHRSSGVKYHPQCVPEGTGIHDLNREVPFIWRSWGSTTDADFSTHSIWLLQTHTRSIPPSPVPFYPLFHPLSHPHPFYPTPCSFHSILTHSILPSPIPFHPHPFHCPVSLHRLAPKFT